jgi:hypothetical protein
MPLRQRLTKRVVDAAVAPLKGSQYLWDSEVPGFALRVYTGADGVLRRIYCVRFSSRGRDCWITIGHHGTPWRPDARGNPRTRDRVRGVQRPMRARGAAWLRAALRSVPQLLEVDPPHAFHLAALPSLDGSLVHAAEVRSLDLRQPKPKARPLDRGPVDESRQLFHHRGDASTAECGVNKIRVDTAECGAIQYTAECGVAPSA